MKFSFTTFDLICAVEEIREKVIGCRVNNVYDVNNKTYLLKLTRNEEKFVLLIESGARIHLTDFEWTKGVMPSGFSMKLRKHIRNRRLSNLRQLGMDRVVDIQFGFEENSFHLIAELYDRGNMCFADDSYTILHLLRPRTDTNHDVRYATHEKYPLELLKSVPECIQLNSVEAIRGRVFELIGDASGPWSIGDESQKKIPIVKALSSEFGYGGPLIEHCCVVASLNTRTSTKGEMSQEAKDQIRLMYAQHFSQALHNMILRAHRLLPNDQTDIIRGYVFGKKRQPEDEELSCQDDFHPFLFEQYRNKPHIVFPTFNQAVDAYFSKIEYQRTNERIIQTEKKASKKLENIKRDHENRLLVLKADQEADLRKASLLENNQKLVDDIILMLNHALCNQIDWNQLALLVDEAKNRGDPLANHIVRLNLQFNQVTVRLSDPFSVHSDDENTNTVNLDGNNEQWVEIVIDLDMNALNNARKYYDKRRAAVKKEEKTLIASHKAMKSAALKARQTQQEFKTIMQIAKVRKSMWFEKFFWFISSENYLVVAGRDALQNEALVKRYLGPDDIYVHADVHGASSVIIKARPWTHEESGNTDSTANPMFSQTTNLPLPPPKTLIEAGVMAVTFSSAWNARVITNAYWVKRDQVSKTAPSGEYLTTGSFMIRGRKNYLPPCHLVYGFGILFKLDEDSMQNHTNERKIANADVTSTEAADLISDVSFTVPDDLVPVDKTDTLEDSFPDAELRLNLLTLQQQRSEQTKSRTSESNPESLHGRKLNSELSNNQVRLRSTQPCKSGKHDTPAAPNEPQRKPSSFATEPLKRGQKSKLKKIQQKYSEQDEDERLLRMQLLQGESAKLSKQHNRLARCVGGNQHSEQLESDVTEVIENDRSDELTVDLPAEEEREETGTSTFKILEDEGLEQENEEDREEEATIVRVATDDLLNLLGSFTGQPFEEDVLLYALPVCAPYTALTNYKFKIKLVPGTTKRGKASKSILQHFLADKSASSREKELLRVLKSEDISRNFPGSVKISLPQGKTASKKC